MHKRTIIHTHKKKKKKLKQTLVALCSASMETGKQHFPLLEVLCVFKCSMLKYRLFSSAAGRVCIFTNTQTHTRSHTQCLCLHISGHRLIPQHYMFSIIFIILVW